MKPSPLVALMLLLSVMGSAIADDLPRWTSSSGSKIHADILSVDEESRTVTLLVPKVVRFDQLDSGSLAQARRLLKAREAASKRTVGLGEIRSIAESSNSGPSELSPDFKIASDDKQPPHKRSVEIILEDALTEKELEAIAMQVRAADRQNYERTFILYYLAGMERGFGCWATSHYNPNLEVKILGFTAEKSKELSTRSKASEAKFIGRWMDNAAFSRCMMELFVENGTHFLRSTYSDNSSSVNKMIRTPSSDGLRFVDAAKPTNGEFYLVNASGDLEVHDRDGLIYKAIKIE